MPPAGKYPRLRVSVKRGRAGQVWTSYWYDHRGHGIPDAPLGTDYDLAIERWTEITYGAPRRAGTLEEAFLAWESDPDGLLADRLAAETRKGYAKCLKALRPVFGSARWEDVSMPVLIGYVRARTAKGRARQEMQLLSVIWNYARMQGMTALHWPAKDMGKTQWKGKNNERRVEVSDAAYEALHRHADRTLRDALDIATATGLRVTDVLALRLSDVRNGELTSEAAKTGKLADFDLSASNILQPIIDRRKAMRGVEHLFILAAGRRPVTYRMLAARFEKARAAAALEVPECADLFLRDMRKRAAALADSLAQASQLLQHSSLSVTRKHYRAGDKIKPVR